MATAPFTTEVVGYAGQALPRDRRYDPTARAFWLGKPGNMLQIASPSAGYTVPVNKGESSITLGNGGTSSRFLADFQRVWGLSYSKLIGADLQLILAFYGRYACGNGPWCFNAPEQVNKLTLAQSLCGKRRGVAEGWTPTVGTVAYDSTVTPAVLPSGVLRWSGAGLNSQLVAGGVSGGAATADMTLGSPYIASVPWTGTKFVAKASGSASARLQLLGLAADGTTIVATKNGPTVALASSPTRLAVTADAGDLGAAAYIVLVEQCLTASAPNLLSSAPQLQIGPQPTDWEAGNGFPRVKITNGLDDVTIDSVWGTSLKLALGT